ncbi:hypothetical protein VTL71DRAFT_9017 [Oculimacula yallundae]|uniref:CCHC-type domain-containing protein n=1 Tax=Oculimacula yallundae TaxID=86028 RepID=A0ABR4BTJ9_9HELO
MLTSPSTISKRDLFTLSQRELAKRLPLSTSSRATFSIYLRWLEVHRLQETKRTVHWGNTVMHWVQSLKKRGFKVEEVVSCVESWREGNGPFEGPRKPPSESQIRSAFGEEGEGVSGSVKKERVGARFGEDGAQDRREEMGGRSRSESRRGEQRERKEVERDETDGGDSRWMKREQDWMERRDEEWNEGDSRWMKRGDEREQEWVESQRDKKFVDKTKYDGPPPPGYICNRCGKKGHHLQVCPTNLDPAYDRPPPSNYQCEICHVKGEHWKSLCPKNSDPYSIIQKRMAKGINTPAKGRNPLRDEWERDTKAERERERDRYENRSRLTDSSHSSARNTPTPSKKTDLLGSLQDIEDKKQRLFREQSDDMGDMIREGTVQRASDRKRSMPDELQSTSSLTPSALQSRKKARTSGGTTPVRHISGRYDRAGTPQTQDNHIEELQHDDTDINGHDASSVVDAHRRPSTPSIPSALRPIGTSPVSMISDEGDSDGMEIDEYTAPSKEYSPFVRHLLYKRPEMNERVNTVKKRKTAMELWKEMDRRTIPKPPVTRTPAESRSEYGRLSPAELDEEMGVQSDGAYYDYLKRAGPDVRMSTAEAEIQTVSKDPSHTSTEISSEIFSNSPSYITHQPSEQEHKMASSTENTASSTPTNSPSHHPNHVHFPPRPETSTSTTSFPKKKYTDAEVDRAFKQFAIQQRNNVEAIRVSRASNDRNAKAQALKEFSTNFRLTTPVPEDLVSIMSNDEAKQKEIVEKSNAAAREFACGNGRRAPSTPPVEASRMKSSAEEQ